MDPVCGCEFRHTAALAQMGLDQVPPDVHRSTPSPRCLLCLATSVADVLVSHTTPLTEMRLRARVLGLRPLSVPRVRGEQARYLVGVATPPPRPSRFFDGVVTAILVVAVAGHSVRAWDLPRIGGGDDTRSSGVGSGVTLDPRSLTLAYARVSVDGRSPWTVEQTEQVMLRLLQRWPEATQRRSRLQVLEESELRDVLVIFSDRPVNILALRNTPAARYTKFAGGRIRIIEVYVVGPFDADEHAGSLLHELGHVLGCCHGPGTEGGHWVGLNCTRLLCSPHGAARTFHEEELRQMGLGG